LESDFVFDDNTTMISLQNAVLELKKSKLDYAGPPPPNELPQKKLGVYVPPPISQQIGHRTQITVGL